MFERTRRIVNDSYTWLANQYFKGQTRFYDQIQVGDDTNYVRLASDGHLTMAGTARPWRDQLTDALQLQRSGTGVALDVTEAAVDFAYNAVYHATFTSADAVYLNIQLNHDKDLTASVYPHIHYWQARDFIPNWLLGYRWQANLGTKTTGWTLIACNTNAVAYTSGTINQIAYSAAIAVPAGTAISDILQFRIYRDTGNASTKFAGVCPYNTGGNLSAFMTAFDVHFMINSLGSTDEYTK